MNPVTLNAGGVSAPVAYAGLTPGFVGLCQINATMPEGAPSGNAVLVTVSVAGQTGAPVAIAVEYSGILNGAGLLSFLDTARRAAGRSSKASVLGELI